MTNSSTTQQRVEFIKASTWHGTLDRAEAMLAAHPELASSDIHIAAILGDDAAVRAFLARDPASATAKSGPRDADALNYLCLSKYLRLDPSRSDAFLRAATALLDAGADPNTGFWTKGEHKEFETALYGAAGVAHHAPLTRLLLERGADPNDGEVAYHTPESYDLAALQAVVETGKLRPESLSLMLLRKIDWHDLDGVRYLLEHGADSNGTWGRRGWRPLHHALARSNWLPVIESLLDHHADPRLDSDGQTAIVIAAREGRQDVLAAFAKRGVSIDRELQGIDRLIAACAMDDSATIRAIAGSGDNAGDADAERQKTDGRELVRQIVATEMGGNLLAKFTGNGNAAGVRQLLDLGVDVGAPFAEGDGYFDEPKGSLAIHIAAWRAYPEIVKLLIARGSPVDQPDANGRTPLALAIRAAVDSYWQYRRTTESIDALLRAGASARGVPFPTGYAEADDLLRRHGAGAPA